MEHGADRHSKKREKKPHFETDKNLRNHKATNCKKERKGTTTALNPHGRSARALQRQGDARSKERQVRGNHVNANLRKAAAIGSDS